MEVLAIIPARGGSKSIKRKNIKLIAGKPMVFYSIEACKNSKYITKIVVSTEDSEIKQICLSFGADVIDRPINLAQDETKTATVMVHALKKLEQTGYKPDYILLIQPTSPFRTSKLIDEAFNYFLSKPQCDSCFSGFLKGTSHGHWRGTQNGKLESLYDYLNRPRRQDSDKHYNLICENGAFYAITYEKFKKMNDFIGETPCVFITDINFDVDEMHDFERAEQLIKDSKINF